jgi:hypothetical protein
VRVLRTAVGRRALQVALLVGGLFVLGFLSGEQAHAAERTRPVSSEGVQAGPLDGVRSLTGDVIDTVGALTRVSAGPTAPAAPAAHSGTPANGPKPVHVPGTSDKPHPEPGAKPGTAPRPAPHLPAHSDPIAKSPARSHPLTKPPAHPPTTGLGTGAGAGAGDQVFGPSTGGLAQAVGEGVLRPVGGLVETVTTGLGRVAAQIPPLSSLPELSLLSNLPDLPALPELPASGAVPMLPDLPGASGHTLPAPAPAAQAPQSDAAGHAAEAAVDDRRSGGGAGGTAYGPGSASHVTRADATPAQRHAHRVAGAGHAPVQQAPDGDPTGELLSHAAVDNGTSRHSDAHAVTLSHRAPAWLLPGAAARAVAVDTRDRHRDIPVFPG